MTLEAAECQLILIDHQERLMPAIANGQAVLARARLLAEVARLMGVPILGTEQNPAKLGPMDAALRGLCAQVLPKLSFSACRDGLVDLVDAAGKPKPSPNAKSIPKHLQKPVANGRAHLVLAGCEAHVCLLQTALDLLQTEEFEVSVVTDACGSRTDRDRDAAFDRLAGEGAQLITVEMAAFEWLGSCEHPRFSDVLALIK
jgi:nicotinamidase-related amidase